MGMLKSEKNTEMKQNNRKKERKKYLSGLNLSLFVMTIIPLLVLGVVVSIFVYQEFTAVMKSEMEEKLKSTALIVKNTYEYAYPGDYDSVGKEQVAIVKGEKVLNGDYELIDSIKKETGSEVTFFYGNTRIITTITDKNGNRVIGTTIRNSVVHEVIESKKSMFYDNIMIDGHKYFAYYLPVENSDGICRGMIAILQREDIVKHKLLQAVIPALIIALMGMVIMAVISYRYSNYLIRRISKIKNFLVKTSNGDFKVRVDETVLNKNDELSEIGRVAEKMQSSLRKLVEQDSLTEMNNRRYGDKFLEEVHKKYMEDGTPFSVAIIDVDYFKHINDTYGHQCGDIVLKEIAKIFKDSMAGKGFAVRWGGEEFLLVFERNSTDKAYEYMERILEKVRRKEFIYNENVIKVTVTCGMAEGCEKPIHVIVREADDRLYEGKQNGRNRIVR